MSSNKILIKDRIVTCGNADGRVVLDHEAGLVYQYQDPSNVIAVFEPKQYAWLMPKIPYYSSGGWGRGGRGDRDEAKPGVYLHSIAHGKGRPNNVYKPVNHGDLDQYVCGEMTHSGREHAPLDLGQKETDISADGSHKLEQPQITFKLWRLVGNTTVANFTITGDVD